MCGKDEKPKPPGPTSLDMRPNTIDLSGNARKSTDRNSPLADLGIFAKRETTISGVGKLKHNESSANPFYATMAASAEASAKGPASNTQPQLNQKLKVPLDQMRLIKIGG